jgi:hypothetical protein
MAILLLMIWVLPRHDKEVECLKAGTKGVIRESSEVPNKMQERTKVGEMGKSKSFITASMNHKVGWWGEEIARGGRAGSPLV